MQVSPETMQILMEMDCPPAQKVALLKAMERDWQAYQQPASLNGTTEERERLRNESTYAERKRAKDRERQRRLREEQRQSRDVAAMSRDVAVTGGDEPATDGDAAPSPLETKSPPTPPKKTQSSLPPSPPKGGSVPQKRASRRAPADWCPQRATIEALAGEGYSAGELERAAAMMRDHEFKSPRTDWDATYRNWVRRDPPRAQNVQRLDQKRQLRESNYDRAFAGAEAAARARAERG